MLIKNTLDKFFLVLIGLSSNIPINLVGVIKLGEILSCFYFFLNLITYINEANRSKYLKMYAIFISVWMILGLASSYINGNDEIGILKGLANIIITFITFATFYLLLKNNIRNVIYYLVPYGLASILFSPFVYSIPEAFSNNLLLIGLDFSDSEFFDVYLSPVLTPIILSVAIFFHRKQFIASVIFFAYGLCALMFDAKSVGFIFVLTFVTFFVKNMGIKLTPSRVRFISIIAPISMILLIFLAIKSDILPENSSVRLNRYLDRTTKFNPFIILGRPDPIVGLIALSDQPIYGHGFNKLDTKYTEMAQILGFIPDDLNFRHEGIPSHSNLINSMVEGGIFAGVFFIFILSSTFKSFLKVCDAPQFPLTLFLIFSFFYLFWNVNLSTTLRLDIGYFIAIQFHFLNERYRFN